MDNDTKWHTVGVHAFYRPEINLMETHRMLKKPCRWDNAITRDECNICDNDVISNSMYATIDHNIND